MEHPQNTKKSVSKTKRFLKQFMTIILIVLLVGTAYYFFFRQTERFPGVNDPLSYKERYMVRSHIKPAVSTATSLRTYASVYWSKGYFDDEKGAFEDHYSSLVSTYEHLLIDLDTGTKGQVADDVNYFISSAHALVVFVQEYAYVPFLKDQQVQSWNNHLKQQIQKLHDYQGERIFQSSQ